MLLELSLLITSVGAQHSWSQPWNPCNESLPNANCDLRQKVTLFGKEVYSPDYAGIDRTNCVALRKPWVNAMNNWPYNNPPTGPVMDSAKHTQHVVLYSTRTYEQVSSGTTLTLASRSPTHTNTLTQLPPYRLPTYPVPPPCAITPGPDCASRQSAFRSRDPVYRRSTLHWFNPHEELAPGCTRGCGKPYITATGISILYRPTPMPSAASSGQAPHQTGAGPMVTAGVADEMTVFNMNTPLVKIATIRAENNCGPIGKEQHDVTFQASEPLKTGDGRFRAPQQTLSPINFEDFNQPLKKEVYQKLSICRNTKQSCKVPVVNGYNPQMQLPKEVRSLDPAWNSAYLDVYGYPITAVALTPTLLPKPSS